MQWCAGGERAQHRSKNMQKSQSIEVEEGKGDIEL
jgi:hypothetical protein